MYEDIHFTNCEHPRLIKNRYNGEFLYVPCGTCAVCCNRKSAILQQRLTAEIEQHRYNFFFTLTYDDDALPTAHFHVYKDCIAVLGVNRAKFNADRTYQYYYEDDFGNVSVPIKEVPDNELDWLHRTSSQRHGIVNRHDVICFIKRLNIYFRRKYGILQNAFRFFVASEYGPSTFRPHYHGIFFTNSALVAQNLYAALCACWKNGFIDFSSLNSSSKCLSYITKYVSSNSCYPKIFSTKIIKPFVLYSRCPSLGFVYPGSETHKKIVNTILQHRNNGHDQGFLYFVSCLPLYVKTSLFPKCRQYRSQSLADLHRTYATCKQEHFPLKFLTVSDDIAEWTVYRSDSFFKDLLNKKDLDNFRPDLYSDEMISKRVNKLANLVGISRDDYVDCIYTLYDACQYNQLVNEYRLQELYTSTRPNSVKNLWSLNASLVHRLTDALLMGTNCPASEYEFLGEQFRNYGIDILYTDWDYSRNRYIYSFNLDALDKTQFSLLTSEINYIAKNKRIAHDADKTKKLNDSMNVLSPSFDMKEYLKQKKFAKYGLLNNMYHLI